MSVMATEPGGQSWLSSFFGGVFGGSFTSVLEDAYSLYLQTGSEEQALAFIRQSDAHKTRFAAWHALQAKGRPVSEAAIMDLERTYTQIGSQFGVPATFFDTDYLAKIISAEKSPAEFQAQMQAWSDYERETRDPVQEQEINRQFAALGLVPDDGDYLMALLRPDIAPKFIERRLEAGLVSAQAVRSGFGALSLDEGLTLADRGVTREQAEAGFGALADNREVFAPLPGEAGADIIGRQEQLGAAFGADSMARQRIERQRRRRQAEYEGGGGISGGRSGLAGLGSA